MKYRLFTYSIYLQHTLLCVASEQKDKTEFKQISKGKIQNPRQTFKKVGC